MTAIRTTSPGSSAGFTLVELLIALLVITVGLLGLLQSINVAYEHTLRTRLREQAVALGEEQMLALRRLPRATPFTPVTTVLRSVGGATTSYTVTRESRAMQETRRLQVTVGWEFKGASLRHVVYSLKR